jgi:hypothetical protein
MVKETPRCQSLRMSSTCRTPDGRLAAAEDLAQVATDHVTDVVLGQPAASRTVTGGRR